MTSAANRFVLSFALVAALAACGDDSRPTDTGAGDATIDSTTGDATPDGTTDADAMCIELGAGCDGTIPCCAPNGCAGGFCGAPRPDAGGDGATCADFGESCATLPCCEGTAQCVMPALTCQPGMGG